MCEKRRYIQVWNGRKEGTILLENKESEEKG